MSYNLRECIEYLYEHRVITYGNYIDLLNDLDNLLKDQESLTNIRLYGYMKTPEEDEINE